MKTQVVLAALCSAFLLGVAHAEEPAAVQEAYLKASNADSPDYFGRSVAIDGTTAVVAARNEGGNGMDGEDDNSLTQAGAAYVYEKQPDGSWLQQAYLKASNAESFDRLGDSVAISGDTIVVGAFWEGGDGSDESNNSERQSGAAYVYEKIDGVWIQTAYLKASNAETGDNFGCSVAVSGETIVIAASGEDGNGVDGEENNSAAQSGAIYVFGKDGDGIWKQEAYLKSSNAEANDGLGNGFASERPATGRIIHASSATVSIHGKTIVAGAQGEDGNGVDGEDNNDATNSGAAYVFVKEGGVWSQQAYLKASNQEAGDSFGNSVSVWGDTVVVGASLEDGNGTDGESDNSATNAGAAYVFVRDELGKWTQQAYLKASNADADDVFGKAVSVYYDTVVVGARIESSGDPDVETDNSASGAGAAYVYTRHEGGNWTQQAYLKASNVEGGDNFGNAIAISGQYAVVAAAFEDADKNGDGGENDNNDAGSAGAAYIFHLPFVTLPRDPDTGNGRAIRRPDLHIGTSWNRLKGDNRYDRRKASRQQTVNLPGRIFRNHTANVKLVLENDGNRRDSYRLSVKGTSNPGITVKAFASGKGGRRNVTGKTKRKGYTCTLAPGEAKRVMYQVKTGRYWAGAMNGGGRRLNRFEFVLKGSGQSDVGEMVTRFR